MIITKRYLGNTEVVKTYLGSQQVYSSAVVADDVAAINAIEAQGVTLSSPQKTAITNRIEAYKNRGIWAKARGVYLFIGGSSGAHTINAKDPRNLDAAFRLEFVGGMTHNANGITGDGISGYFKTFFPSNTLGLNNLHLNAYVRNIVSDTTFLLTAATNTYLYYDNTTGQKRLNGRINGVFDGQTVINQPNRGLMGSQLNNSSNLQFYTDDKLTTTGIGGGTNDPNADINGMLFNGANYANVTFQSVLISEPLTGEQIQLNFLDELAFQKALNRELDVNTVFYGDALVQGIQSKVSTAIDFKLRVDNKVLDYIVGHEDQLTNAPAVLNPVLIYGDNSVVVVGMTSHDFLGSLGEANGADKYAILVDIVDFIKTKGVDRIIVTTNPPVPTGTASEAAWNTEIGVYNGLIRDNAVVEGWLVADIAAETEFATYSATYQTGTSTYTAAGEQVIADVIAAVVNPII